MEYYEQNELPDTVRRYKAYTKSFQKWLLKTAVQRGLECANELASQNDAKTGNKITIEHQQRLIDKITQIPKPLTDTSGLLDLEDAIRARKEIAYFHQTHGMADDGHAFFNVALEEARSKFSTLSSLKILTPIILKASKPANETLTHVFALLPPDDFHSDSDITAQSASLELLNDTPPTESDKKAASPPRKKSNVALLTQDEITLKRDYSILSFLYELMRIRVTLRAVWSQYNDKSMSPATAALVTDLAFSYVQQNVAALVEELEEDGALPTGGLLGCVIDLCNRLLSSLKKSGRAEPSTQMMYKIFCMSAFNHIKAYNALTRENATEDPLPTNKQYPFISLLRYFDRIRTKKIRLPQWDKFTEDMLLRKESSPVWMPFNLQIMLDMQSVMREDFGRLNRDITEHAMEISHLMRVHAEYEDAMWDQGTIPDYMDTATTKFSTQFLQPADTLLTWIDEVVQGETIQTELGALGTGIFATVHSTLGGLAMSYYNKAYQIPSIIKVQWFVTCLCHIYNAAKQVGGLEVDWPDLDFILYMHGAQRLFVGEPPTNPNDFESRLLLAMGVSTKYMASDYRRSAFAPKISRAELHEKHGLLPRFELEEKLKALYGAKQRENRWLKRHAVFNHLQKNLDDGRHTCEATQADRDAVRGLQDVFATLASQLTPGKSKQKKARLRVHMPDFTEDASHAPLLKSMAYELQSHELHDNFDFLSFYRNGLALMTRIRNEVLYTKAAQEARLENVSKNPEPKNYSLILELFRKFKSTSKVEAGKSVRSQGFDQVRQIAKVMTYFIRTHGSAELERASLRQKGDWPELKATCPQLQTETKEEDKENTNPSTQQIHAEKAAQVPKTTQDHKPMVNVHSGLSNNKQPLSTKPSKIPVLRKTIPSLAAVPKVTQPLRANAEAFVPRSSSSSTQPLQSMTAAQGGYRPEDDYEI